MNGKFIPGNVVVARSDDGHEFTGIIVEQLPRDDVIVYVVVFPGLISVQVREDQLRIKSPLERN